MLSPKLGIPTDALTTGSTIGAATAGAGAAGATNRACSETTAESNGLCMPIELFSRCIEAKVTVSSIMTLDGTEPPIATIGASPRDVVPNLAMFTVDFSMREAPMVRR